MFLSGLSAVPAHAGLEVGNTVRITLRGVGLEEQAKINGDYRIGESGAVKLPLLDGTVRAAGLTLEQFCRAAEAAYVAGGIYSKPAIEAMAVTGKETEEAAAVISVGGQIRRAGQFPFRKNMTVLQALDAAGGRNDFASRNILLVRDKKQYCLDFNQLKHKSIILRPDDSLQVEQRGVLDGWRGEEQALTPLYTEAGKGSTEGRR